MLHSRFSLVICFICGVNGVYVSIVISQFVLFPFPPLVSMFVLCVCVFVSVLQISTASHPSLLVVGGGGGGGHGMLPPPRYLCWTTVVGKPGTPPSAPYVETPIKQRSQVLCGCISRSVGAPGTFRPETPGFSAPPPPQQLASLCRTTGAKGLFQEEGELHWRDLQSRWAEGLGRWGVAGSLGGGAPLFADSDEAFLGRAAFNFPTKKPGKRLPWRSSG